MNLNAHYIWYLVDWSIWGPKRLFLVKICNNQVRADWTIEMRQETTKIVLQIILSESFAEKEGIEI